MKLKARIQLDPLKLEMALISTILPKSRILLESQSYLINKKQGS